MGNHGVQVASLAAFSPIAKWKEREEALAFLKALHHLLRGSQAVEGEAQGTRIMVAQKTRGKD